LCLFPLDPVEPATTTHLRIAAANFTFKTGRRCAAPSGMFTCPYWQQSRQQLWRILILSALGWLAGWMAAAWTQPVSQPAASDRVSWRSSKLRGGFGGGTGERRQQLLPRLSMPATRITLISLHAFSSKLQSAINHTGAEARESARMLLKTALAPVRSFSLTE
jgi:hypothetical protein